MYYVYVLYSKKDEGLYVGYSSDLEHRLSDHKKGYVNATAQRRPLTLIHFEGFINKKDAMNREQYLKTGWGRRHLKQALQRTLKSIQS